MVGRTVGTDRDISKSQVLDLWFIAKVVKAPCRELPATAWSRAIRDWGVRERGKRVVRERAKRAKSSKRLRQ